MQDDSASAFRQPGLERRLATIMMADVFGYSRMMGENEERTFATLRGHREIFDELLKLHRGRVFNTAGDAILAEFPSAVEAVRCATEVQAALRTRNDHLPSDERMLFRIGINLGDVIVQGGDLLGDGVNVAARIQTVAEPGGICISGSVTGTASHATGTVSPNGTVEISIDGFASDGKPMAAKMSGTWANDAIVVDGAWANNARVNGNWRRAQ